MSLRTFLPKKLSGRLSLHRRQNSPGPKACTQGWRALISGACLVLGLFAGCVAREKEAPISEHTILPVGSKVSLGEQYWGPLMWDYPQVIPPINLDPPPGSLAARLWGNSPRRPQPNYFRPHLEPLPYSQKHVEAYAKKIARHAATNGVLIYRANPVRVMFNDYPANLMSQKPGPGQGYLAFEVTLANYTVRPISVKATDFLLWTVSSAKRYPSDVGARDCAVSVEAMKAMAVPARFKLYQAFLPPRSYCTGLIAFIVDISLTHWRIDYVGAYYQLALPEELVPYVFSPRQEQAPATPSY